ncbi:MAG: hypothetical protein GF311_15475 [Candidatus Lokiarchaeota archaeon]|nr:hypothetical protein [Candidatus Lokiarchaeota archaeon]
MTTKPKKILLVGIDQAIPCLINTFVDEGLLPNIKTLIETGVKGEAYSCPPCDTPTNWSTIATGATTAVHGATSFYMHIPGEPLDYGLKIRSRSSLSKYCGAKYFWEAADDMGFKSFILNYPGGWPGNLNNGVVSLLTWPLPESIPMELSLKTRKKYSLNSPNPSLRIIPIEKEFDIKFDSFSPPLKIIIKLDDNNSIEEFPAIEAYIIDTEKKGYNALAMKAGKENEWEIVNTNQWTNWISNTIQTVKYGELPCLFKLGIKKLKSDGSSLELQFSSIYSTKGWTNPEELGEKIIRNAIIYDLTREQQKVDYMISGAVKSYLGLARNEALTIANAIRYMKNSMNWDICFFHIHHLDSVNHRSLGNVYEESPFYTEKKAGKYWEHIRIAYQITDELVGLLVESVVNDDTIIVLVSDHGAIPTWRVVNPLQALMNSGLLNYKQIDSKDNYIVDWKKTKAFPYLEPPYVWVNLKGRDPDGIVNQSEYEDVRDEIIESLYQLRDPDTGEKIIKLAIKREDAEYLGQNGPRVGDVIYFLNPPYQLFDYRLEKLDPSIQPKDLLEKPAAYNAQVNCAAHAYFLPDTKLGEYSISVPLIINGPSIKSGVELKKIVNLIDLAPTLADLLGIPQPKSFQGKVLHQIIE